MKLTDRTEIIFALGIAATQRADTEAHETVDDEALVALYRGTLSASTRAQTMHAIAHHRDNYHRWLQVVEQLHSAEALAAQIPTEINNERNSAQTSNITALVSNKTSWLVNLPARLTQWLSAQLLHPKGMAGVTAVLSLFAVIIFVSPSSYNEQIGDLYREYRTDITPATLPTRSPFGAIPEQIDVPLYSAVQSSLAIGVEHGRSLLANPAYFAAINPRRITSDNPLPHESQNTLEAIGQLLVLNYLQCAQPEASTGAYFVNANKLYGQIKNTLAEGAPAVYQTLYPIEIDITNRSGLCTETALLLKQLQ